MTARRPLFRWLGRGRHSVVADRGNVASLTSAPIRPGHPQRAGARATPVRLAALALLLLVATLSSAQEPPPVPVDAGFQRQELSPHLQILEDPAHRLEISSAQAAAGYRPVPAQGGNLGFSKSAWWVRFGIANTGDQPLRLLLRQAYPLIDDLQLWISDRDGGLRHVHTGDQQPFASRELDLRNFVFELVVPPGATLPVHLRYASSGTLDISLELFAPAPLVAAVGVEQLAFGMYYGGFLALIVYNLIIFLAVRDRVFFWYLLYAVVFGLHFGVHNGFSYQFLWPGSPAWANQSLVVLLALSLIFALQFTRGFLDARRMMPRMDAVALVLQVLAGVVLAASFALSYETVVVPIAYVTVMVTALILTMGTRSLLAGYRPARYFMLAWAAMLLTVFAYLLKAFGVLPHNVLTQNGFQIGSLLEMTLLSVALSARVRDLHKHSFSDPLTNLLNRRSFDQHLELEFARARRAGVPVALLMADIDHFKLFNDRHGHARGDEALRVVARKLREGVRQGDVVCRYGGEEFAIILPGATCEEAGRVAEKLRLGLTQVQVAGQSVTLSIGAACSLGEPFADADELFRTADEALYEAKAAGRDRVVRKHKGCFEAAGPGVPA